MLSADGHFDEADAAAAATMPCSALALETGTGSKKILHKGFLRVDAWGLTPGGYVYIANGGGLTQTIPSTSGDQVQIVGLALTADILWFDPQLGLTEVA